MTAGPRGVEEKLTAGATVADVGCGYGAPLIAMAEAYPRSRFFGFDYHDASIARARQAAADAGVGDRVRFEVATAKDIPDRRYELITYFDATMRGSRERCRTRYPRCAGSARRAQWRLYRERRQAGWASRQRPPPAPPYPTCHSHLWLSL